MERDYLTYKAAPKEKPPVAEYDTAADATFCERTIGDNERFNSLGIPDADVSVCFEMSHLCNYGGSGSTFTTIRFKEALAAMSGVIKRGDRWFPTTSKGKARPVRVCAYSKCDADISHLHGRAQTCSPSHRVAYNREKAK